MWEEMPRAETETYYNITEKGERLAGLYSCLLYTSDAADELLCVDLGGRRIIKKKNTLKKHHKNTNPQNNNN